MPRLPIPAAYQLGSVCARYRSAWGRQARLARSVPPWGSSWARGGDDDRESSDEAAATARRPQTLARLEAVLFLSREPLAARRAAQLAALADATEARTLIRQLNKLYDRAGTAFRAEEVGGGWQLMSRPQFGPWLRRLHASPIQVRLSAPALETLAVVAYRQPVLRAEVEAIRGVQCGEMLRQLMERDLVRIVGKSDELGRPFQYGTTRRFLEAFGLRRLDELPHSAALVVAAPHGRGDGSNSTQVSTEKFHTSTEESQVTVSLDKELAPTDWMLSSGVVADPQASLPPASVRAADEAEADWVEEEEDDEDEEEDDDEDDWEDDDEEDDDLDEEEDEDDEDDEDDDWEEVDDEDEDWDDEEEDDEEDDDDDWDDDDEEEEDEEEWEDEA